MKANPTIHDVAALAGVSKSTAQRALSGHPRCSESARQAVRQAAKKLRYRPDPIFSAMGTRRRIKPQKGLPVAFIESEHTPSHYFEPARTRASQLGYDLQYIHLPSWEGFHNPWKTLYSRGFVGLLIGRVPAPHHKLLRQNTLFPAVCCGRLEPLPYNSVRPAIVSSIRTVWAQLLARHYQRIGAAILRHTIPVEDDFTRYSAVLGCQMESIPKLRQIPALRCAMDDVPGFLHWLKQYRPDAIIGFHAGLYHALRDAGYRIPQDIGFAVLHEGQQHRKLHISGLDQNPTQIAVAAVNMLDQMIRHGERGLPSTPLTVIVESTWIDGRTLRAP